MRSPTEPQQSDIRTDGVKRGIVCYRSSRYYKFTKNQAENLSVPLFSDFGSFSAVFPSHFYRKTIKLANEMRVSVPVFCEEKRLPSHFLPRFKRNEL